MACFPGYTPALRLISPLDIWYWEILGSISCARSFQQNCVSCDGGSLVPWK